MNEQNLNELNKDDFIFGGLVLGIKGMPFNTELLLVNNIPDSTLDIIYAVDNSNQVIKLPLNSVKNISYETKVRMQNSAKRVESHETQSMLLSAAMFGGNPILQVAGAAGINSLFEDLSQNYVKVSFQSYYEISIDVVADGVEKSYVLNTDVNPGEFVERVKDTINAK